MLVSIKTKTGHEASIGEAGAWARAWGCVTLFPTLVAVYGLY